jgi:hypothetical protein
MLTNQDKACVTIILPLHRFIANGKMDQKHLQKAIHTAGEQLKVRYPEYEADFLESLNALSREIEFDFSMDGIGIFVSTDFKAYTYFPFNVTEKVVVGNNLMSRMFFINSNWNCLIMCCTWMSTMPGFIMDVSETWKKWSARPFPFRMKMTTSISLLLPEHPFPAVPIQKVLRRTSMDWRKCGLRNSSTRWTK